MRVYDFDGTIYDGDSVVDFYLFCLRRHPQLMVTLIANAHDALMFKTNRLSRSEFKERFFRSFLTRIDAETEVDAFWRRGRKKIKSWYYDNRKPGDVIASASPSFILAPLCQSLGVTLIATSVNPSTGELIGENMRGEHKVTAFQALYPGQVPDEFYTDDLTADAPMVRLAERSFLVRGNTVVALDGDNRRRAC